MGKTLFFFTSSFPFGKGETFIENEIKFLVQNFEKVVIVSNDISSRQTRHVAENVTLLRTTYELGFFRKIFSFRNVFSRLFWQEIKLIKNVYSRRLSLPILNTILQTQEKGNVLGAQVEKMIEEYSNTADSIYLYSYWTNDMAFVIGKLRAKNNRYKAFSRMHRWDIYFEENKVNYLPFRTYIFSNLNTVFSISNDGINYTEKLLRLKDLGISLSRLGVLKRVGNPKGDKSLLEVVSVSNMISVKNISTLIEGLQLLKLDFHWTHIGDGPLKNELEEKAERMIPGKFEFKGAMPNIEVMNFFSNNAIDIFINVSLSEGVPVSIMEAMSFGIPCIATSVGGNPEIINRSNGLILPSRATAIDISNALISFHKLTKEEQLEMSSQAYKTWAEEYNATKNYTQFVVDILSL